jgi:hypothetical protein
MAINIPAGSTFLNTPAIRALLEKQRKKPNLSPAATSELDRLLARPLPSRPGAAATTPAAATSTPVATTPVTTTDDVKRPTPAEKWGNLKG